MQGKQALYQSMQAARLFGGLKSTDDISMYKRQDGLQLIVLCISKSENKIMFSKLVRHISTLDRLHRCYAETILSKIRS